MRWLLVASFAGYACSPPAQVLVTLDAEGAVAELAATLRVCVASQEGTSALDRVVEARFPTTVPVSPRGGDSARRFVMVAELRDARGLLIGRQRIASGFPDSGRTSLPRRFSESCMDILTCGDGETCVDGACVPAGVEVPDLAWTTCRSGPTCTTPGCVPTTTREWIAATTSQRPSARLAPKLVYHERRGTMILYGGRLNPQGLGVEPLAAADMWEYDGAQWVELCNLCAPGPRFEHTLVYDVDRDVLVLVGGLGAPSTLWEWGGSAWVARDVPGGPGPIAFAMATYDTARSRMVMFGGLLDGGAWNDITYEYDGAVWHRLATTPRPPARLDTGSAMAFDVVEGRAVFYGGREVQNDAWAWDGRTWALLCSECLAKGRQGASLVFDAVAGRLLLHGGWSGTGEANPGTYAWDGAEWIEVDPSPGHRDGAAIAFDPVRNRVVMYGGHGSCSIPTYPFYCDETLAYVAQ